MIYILVMTLQKIRKSLNFFFNSDFQNNVINNNKGNVTV